MNKEYYLLHVSLNSVVGLTQLGSMKLKGNLQRRDITIMVDYEATHNFTCVSLLNELKLPLNVSMSYGIILGNGHTVKAAITTRMLHYNYKG